MNQWLVFQAGRKPKGSQPAVVAGKGNHDCWVLHHDGLPSRLYSRPAREPAPRALPVGVYATCSINQLSREQLTVSSRGVSAAGALPWMSALHPCGKNVGSGADHMSLVLWIESMVVDQASRYR